MWRKDLFIIFVAVTGKYIECATLCGNNHFGANNPGGKNKELDSNSDFGYLMSDSNNIVDCCGIVDRWQANFGGVSGSRTIFFQVWRLTSGSTYELVGQNSKTVTADGEQEENVAQADRITVKSGDKWGWWSQGSDIIKYKNGGDQDDDNWLLQLSSHSVGDTQNWGSHSDQDERSYGIRMDVLPNNAPHFTNLPDTASITASTASGTSIFDVSIDDIDTDDVSTLSVSMTANSDYSFDPSTYEVTTANTFITSTVDILEFKVSDQCDNTATATLTISITNQPPVITSLPAAEFVSEDETALTPLHMLNVTDPEGSTATCSLASSSPSSTSFSVAGNIIYSNANPGFDFSTVSLYTLTIDCTDGEYTDTGTFTVNIIQNDPPVFLNLQNSTSVSTEDTLGTNAFTVLVNDTDDLTFSMMCDPTPCPFQIFDSGQIQISDYIDHSTVGYDLSITVSDGRNTVGPKILTITVSDINDPVSISNLPLTISVIENTAVGTTVYTVSYSDLDTSQTYTISMTSSPTSGLTYFSIDSTSGEVTSTGALNFETLASLGTTTFVFDVTVADPVTSDTESLTVEIVNENEAPSFSQSSYTISTTEGTSGTVIGTPSFSVTDPDSGDTATLTFDCGSDTGYFLMDSSSGQVSFQSDYDLDASSAPPTTVTCTVTVTDSGGLTDTCTLTITIADDNDNSPIFSPATYSFHISYYAVVGTSVGTITATDADIGAYGVITYTLDQSSLSAEQFAVSNTGEITVLQTPQGSAVGYATSVTLTATASDVGAQSDTATVVIVISDTTTISTTTTTDRYRTFLEDSRNIAWLSACIVVLLVSLGVLTYVIFTCHGENGCAQFRRTCCRRKKKGLNHRKPRRRNYSIDSYTEDRTPDRRNRRSNSPTFVSFRRHPGPVELQGWRRTVV
ncbi:cadherin-23-like [Mercenaria mercenaria]|uniref:cadherin-23-like n=1 Tax=Mercenaria mercenaria TaxID=6596 RepID=UPI00234E8181|nr:cadherin-23-like [Mercenaria mercenaria]